MDDPNSAAPAARPILQMNRFDVTAADTPVAVQRRHQNAGSATVLFYREPIELASADKAWLTATDGSRYLDMYNNVPAVGHSHPEVVAAVTAQMSVQNTHSRYITGMVDGYMEALKATFPPALANVVMTCSGSEANDLALRIAGSVSGNRGIIVTENAYHGNTALVTDASPASWPAGYRPDYVATVPAPTRAAYGDDVAGGFTQSVREAIATLKARGHGVSALLFDTIFSSDGVLSHPAGFVEGGIAAVRAEGGLYIADEVQPGFGRLGESFWGFARHGVEPDIVTMGKPMGNGFPVAGLVTRPDFLSAYCDRFGYFNTFGASPAAAAAAGATLQVLQRDRMQDNALVVGARIREGLEEIAAADPRCGEVRGIGMFAAIDFCQPGKPLRPDPDLARHVVNALREAKVLAGVTGKFGATLRVRPPLCLTADEADLFLAALRAVLNPA